MDIETYTKRIESINDALQTIANETRGQALTDCADSSNPRFVALMREHQRLTDLSAQLTSSMLPP